MDVEKDGDGQPHLQRFQPRPGEFARTGSGVGGRDQRGEKDTAGRRVVEGRDRTDGEPERTAGENHPGRRRSSFEGARPRPGQAEPDEDQRIGKTDRGPFGRLFAQEQKGHAAREQEGRAAHPQRNRAPVAEPGGDEYRPDHDAIHRENDEEGHNVDLHRRSPTGRKATAVLTGSP